MQPSLTGKWCDLASNAANSPQAVVRVNLISLTLACAGYGCKKNERQMLDNFDLG